jgi:hypothetical protein
MSKKNLEVPAPLASIDADALETASGGRRAAGASSSRASADNAAILDALQDIEVAMREMSAKQSNTSNNDNSNMMMMTMMSSLLNNNNSGGGNCRGRKRGC